MQAWRRAQCRLQGNSGSMREHFGEPWSSVRATWLLHPI